MATVGVHLPLLTGLSLTLKLYPRTSGSIANGASGDALTETGTGYFTATVAETLTGIHRADILQGSVLKYQGWVDMSQASPVVDEYLATITAVDALPSNDDLAAEVVAALSAYEVTVQSAVSTDGEVTIVAGDTYGATTERYLSFTITGSLPDLSAATLTFTAKHKRVTGVSIVGTGALVSQSASQTVIRVSITAAQTANGRAYYGDQWVYDLEATLSGGAKRTLVGPQAPCRVLLDQTQ